MSENIKIVGVPKEIFDNFLVELKTGGMSEDITKRLRKTIIEDGNLTDAALRKAML